MESTRFKTKVMSEHYLEEIIFNENQSYRFEPERMEGGS
jgi:hypothetical protein